MTIEFKCCRCQTQDGPFTHFDGNSYCDLCFMLSDPPVAIVAAKGFTSPIYSYKARLTDAKTTVWHLSRCGWFIRNIRVPIHGEEKLFRLEYNGERVCGRVSPVYTRFPPDAEVCDNHYCIAGGLIA